MPVLGLALLPLPWPLPAHPPPPPPSLPKASAITSQEQQPPKAKKPKLAASGSGAGDGVERQGSTQPAGADGVRGRAKGGGGWEAEAAGRQLLACSPAYLLAQRGCDLWLLVGPRE